jgi:hypothetical protein
LLKVICDRCGKDISDSGKIGYIVLNIRESVGGPAVQENPMKGLHFCASCMGDIQEFAAGPKQASKEAPRPKPSSRRKIDYPKIMALHHAGWSNSKIADEMGMTKSGVYRAIWYYKNRIQGESEEGGDSSGQEDSGPIS